MLLIFLILFSTVSSYLPVSVSAAELESPVVNDDNTVTVTYEDVEAEKVRVAGDFNDWDPSALSMSDDGSGIWTATTSALTPDIYGYKLVVGEDGWKTDPLNPATLSNGNSKLVVPGLNLSEVPNKVAIGSSTSLTANLVDDSGNNPTSDATWSLVGEPTGVSLDGASLEVASDAAVDATFTVKATQGDYETTKEVQVIAGNNEFTVHYYREDPATFTDWDFYFFHESGEFDAVGKAFDSVDDSGDYRFAHGTYSFPTNEVTLLTRKGGENWDDQEGERVITVPEGESATEVWVVEGKLDVFTSRQDAINAITGDEQEEERRRVRLSYTRADETFGDWNIWVWNTGVKDDQINFDTIQGDTAVANIAVSEEAEEIGFVLRSTEDWDTAEKEFEDDQFISVNKNDLLTKAYIISGTDELRVVPDGSAPNVDKGNATFYYRDKELYSNDAMDTIDKVELKINNETYEMPYEPLNERFVYTVNGISTGETSYSYLITKDGTTKEVTDPYNTVDGASTIRYNEQVDLTVSGSVSPAAIDYNQNAVLSVGVEGLTDDIEISEIYADVSSLGNSSKLAIDPLLKEVSIAVDDHVTAGTKEIPLTVVDSYGNQYTSSTQVDVKTRQSVGEEDFDWDESIIYFMLTDRFFDGDSSNNDPYGIGFDTSKSGTYHGGDFEGITERLDYLDDLGVNTIWISPIVENIEYDVRYDATDGIDGEPYYGYHGYWASNFGKLNPHFGTMEEFHRLIDAAHDRGIKIMVDVVLNHTGYGLKEINGTVSNPPEQYPTDADRDRFSDLVRQGSNVGTAEVVGELAGLPDFKTEDPAVRQQIIDWQTAWIENATTPNGNTIDYFRVDTVKHVEDATWMAFKNALTEKMPEHKMIGEVWGASVGNDSGYLESGMMDSLLDFGFKGIAHSFVNGDLTEANDSLIDRNEKIDNTATLGQFLGSHDEDGFLHSLDGDEGKLKVAASLQATAKGQPVIYYGEELGQSGANNYPYYDNRYDLDWDQVEGNDVLAHYTEILNFRADNSDIFAKGDRTTIGGENSEDYLLFSRNYNGDAAYVGLNVAEEALDITVSVDSADAIVTDHYSNQTYNATAANEVSLTLPAIADGGTALLTVEGGSITGVTTNTSDNSDDGDAVEPIPDNHIRIHYQRTENDYENYGAWLWNDVESPSAGWPDGATMFEKTDSYGSYIDVELAEGAQNIGFLVMDVTNGDAGKDGGDKGFTITSPEMNEIWIKQGSDEVFTYEPVDLPENTVRIHYLRDNADYENYGVWNWGDVVAPSETWPTGATDFEGTDRYGAYVDIELTEDAQELGFIVLDESGGGTKDGGNKTFNLLDKYNRLWVKQGDDNVYISPYWDVATGITAAEVISETTIQLNFTMTEGLTAEDLVSDLEIVDADGTTVTVESAEITGDKTADVTATFDINKLPLSITYSDKTVSASSGWKFIDEQYGYEGDDLGATYQDGDATLKLWAPKASKVVANFFDKEDAATEIGSVELTNENGVWTKEVTASELGLSDLDGYYYQYEVTNDGVTKEVLDPYAKSMAAFTLNTEGEAGPDGDDVGKAAIVDLSGTDPEGFSHADIDGYEKREDAVIYEVHVRDFTSDSSIEGDLDARWGSYQAFIDKLDYIESLGVTHVQLLPIMAWYYGDETAMDERELDYSAGGNEYNWGYDPHSYFSPDGAYSEDATKAKLRVEETKALIDAIHDAGMGVVLDVVYTHTAKTSTLNDIVPNYYAFQDAEGNFLGGFGNNLATNHQMAEKLMVDSVKYWFEEYKIDGMRFDMMGDATYPAIQNAYDAAAEINPNALFIGEGWRTFAGDLDDPTLEGMGADQDWMDKTDDVGVFSDEMRNELKSGFGSEGEPRFLTGGARSIETIFNNIKAQPSNTPSDDPGDMVQYIAAHDNLPLFDVIAQSIKKDPAIPENNLEIHKRIRIGNSLVLTSQGTAFIHAGQEYGRTKQWQTDGVPQQKYHELTDENGDPFKHPYFVHDSYDSSDAINMFEWKKVTDESLYPVNTLTQAYTQGLIELRRSTDAFRLGDMELVNSNVTLIDAPEIADQDLLIAYKNESTDETGAYYVFVNADTTERVLTLSEDLTSGTVVVDNDEAGTAAVSEKSGFSLTSDSMSIDPLTTVVIKVSDDEPGTDEPGTDEPGTDEPGTDEPGTDGPGTEEPGTDEPGTDKPKKDKTSKVVIKDETDLVINDNNKVYSYSKKAKSVTINKEVISKLDPDFSVELTNGKATLLIPIKLFPEGTDVTINFEKVSKKVAMKNKDAVSELIDFSIIADGKEITEFPDQPITVTFAVNKNKVKNWEDLKVVYIDENGDHKEIISPISYNKEKGEVVAELTHFSAYGVFEIASDSDDEGASKDNGEALPDTATNQYNWLLVGGLLLVIGAITLVAVRRKRQQS
ncbi:secreted pullulanase [Saliterribacillus persicus]|uniref:pullulanase n=2 Tax=Saliterribacillus persicus TaxID=930114 RepID=A0A368YAZ2_9BACI|nr:secreted pullulanase [Saliterribacillus persicus]